MKVPFLDLKSASVGIAQEIEQAIIGSSRSGYHIMGPELERFENDFARFLGCKHALGLGNGLDALTLGLKAMGVQSGDEVIVPAHTYIATWLAVSQCGAAPIPVEVDERTYNIDPEQVVSAITDRTKAIIAVHLYGQPADLDALRKIAEQFNLQLLEDAAQAHGAKHRGDRIGQQGTATFSFYPSKNLGALGDGGALVTDQPEIKQTVELLRNYGSSIKYQHDLKGVNSRLDPMQAAVLSVKLKYLDKWNDNRRAIAASYSEAFQKAGIATPYVPSWCEPVWHLYVLRHPNRDAFQKRLLDNGIATVIHYPIPPHKQPAYSELTFSKDQFALTERLANEILSLPMCPGQTEEQTAYVIEQVTSLF